MIVSAELGDFESDVHSPGVISEFRFHPEQDEKMEEDVLEKFKELGWVDCDFQANTKLKTIRFNLICIIQVCSYIIEIEILNW